MNLYTDIWTLAIQMDLTHLAEMENNINFYLTGYREKCQNAVNTDNHCSEFLDNIERLLTEVASGVGVIHDLVGAERTRERRGLIDGFGTVIKAITGNLDAADGERIDAEINAIKKTQDNLQRGMKNQLQIVESTMEIFNKTSQTAQRNFHKLHQTVLKVNEYFQNQTNLMRNRQHFDESLMLLDTYVETFLRKIENLVDLFASIASGKVNPRIITPSKLTEYLKDALPHVPRGHSFPQPISERNAASLLRVATPKAYRKGERVTLLLEIPLIGQAEYKINRVYPLPTRGWNDTYYYIEVKEEIVACDTTNRNYVKITKEELKSCKKDGGKYLCTPQHPVVPITETAPCSIQVLLKGKIGQGKRCIKRAIKLTHTLIIGTETAGKWLYVAPSDEAVSIACTGMPTQQQMLRGTGLLTARAKCTVSAASFRVETVRRITQLIPGKEYLPTFNLTITTEEAKAINATRLIVGSEPESIVSSLRELNDIGTRIQRNSDELDTAVQSPAVHQHILQYGIGSLALLIVIVYITYTQITKRTRRRDEKTTQAECHKLNVLVQPTEIAEQQGQSDVQARREEAVYAQPLKRDSQRGTTTTTTRQPPAEVGRAGASEERRTSEFLREIQRRINRRRVDGTLPPMPKSNDDNERKGENEKTALSRVQKPLTK